MIWLDIVALEKVLMLVGVLDLFDGELFFTETKYASLIDLLLVLLLFVDFFL